MWIISKDGRSISNTDMITTAYAAGSGNTIQVNYSTGGGSRIGTYQTDEEAEAALAMLACVLQSGKVMAYRMPTDESVKAWLRQDPDHWHHATGKKTKGHGGS